MDTEKRTILIAFFFFFFTNDTMMNKAHRFSEVFGMDATYNTNNSKMPLICVTGVSNLDGTQLKNFPVAFAWVRNETQGMYEWFLDSMTAAYDENIDAVLVADKCQALMNALDKKLPTNKKLLCIWHMLNNVSDYCVGKSKNVAVKDEWINSVYKMIYSTTEPEYNDGFMNFQEATGNVNNYVDASKGLAVYEYFVNEWISCKEKWAGYITCKLNHLGCTST